MRAQAMRRLRSSRVGGGAFVRLAALLVGGGALVGWRLRRTAWPHALAAAPSMPVDPHAAAQLCPADDLRVANWTTVGTHLAQPEDPLSTRWESAFRKARRLGRLLGSI